MQIKQNVAFDYEIALADGVTTQYPQTKLYDQSDALVTTLDLTHITLGRYNANYTYSGTDKLLKAHTIIYSDSGHTIENTTYNRSHEDLEVVDYATSTAMANAISSLNIITGADGVILASIQILYPPAKAGDAMTLANDSITAAKFDESTAFPLKKADIGVTEIARTGADGDTLETLSDEIAAGGGGATADEIVDAMFAELLAGHTTADTFGELMNTLKTKLEADYDYVDDRANNKFYIYYKGTETVFKEYTAQYDATTGRLMRLDEV